MLFCRATLPLPSKTLTFVSGVILRRRKPTGSPWRALDPGRQAIPVPACLRRGETFPGLAAGSGVSTTTTWRYVNKAVALLADGPRPVSPMAGTGNPGERWPGPFACSGRRAERPV